MSELTNRAAYLKGLADGMKLNTETDEGKLLSEIIGFLNDAAAEIAAIDDEQGFIADKIDDMDEEITVIGNEVFDDYDELDDYDDDEVQIHCDNCGEEIVLSGEDLMDGEIICPNCGETIELDFGCDGNCESCDEDCDL